MREISPHLLTASTVMGDKVTNAEGEDLGELKEIVIDSHSGRVAYAVLGFGGFLGLGEKFFAVPWEAFKVSPEQNRLYLQVSKDQLRDAPGFDKSNWPSSPDREFERRLYAHYGYKPYWEAEVTAPGATGEALAGTEKHELRDDIVRAYSGGDMSGGAGLHSPVVDDRGHLLEEAEAAFSGADLDSKNQGVGFTSADADNTSVFSSTSSMEAPASASHDSYEPDYGREQPPPQNAGIDDRLRDTGGSPARGYGRGGIPRPEDTAASLNPANEDIVAGMATNDRSERDAWAGAGAFGTDPSQQRSTNMNPNDPTRGSNSDNAAKGEDESRNSGSRNRPTGREMTEAEQRALGEQAADEFNPGLTGSVSDIDSSRSSGAGTLGGGGFGSPEPGVYPGGETPPASTRAFEQGEQLPAGHDAFHRGSNRSMSGASGISSAASTGGSEGMSQAEDLEVGSVDDLNVVGTNLGEGYPKDMTVTEDEDTEQPQNIRPGTRRGSTVAGDVPASDTESFEEGQDTGGSGSGRGHSSGSNPGNRQRGSRGSDEGA